MKRHSYGKIISMSLSWTKEILFKPFELKKWFVLLIIALLAGQMTYSLNFRGLNNGGLNRLMNPSGKTAVSPAIVSSQGVGAGETEAGSAEADARLPVIELEAVRGFFRDNPIAVPIAGGVLIIVFLFSIYLLLWMWIQSNFSFVFLESVVKNDASMRVPFHRNKPQGASFFKWRIVYGGLFWTFFISISAIVLAKLIRSGIFHKSLSAGISGIGEMLSAILPYTPFYAALFMIFGIISFLVSNLILPIMYKKKIGIMKGWAAFFTLLKSHFWDIVKFAIVKFLLAIALLLAAILLAIIGILAIALVGLVAALIVAFLLAVIPPAAKTACGIILTILGIPLLIGLGILFNMLFLPIPVFLRAFSIYTLGSLEESLDLFSPKSEDELRREADDGRYKRSMALVWIAVLAPVVIAVMAFIAALAVPNFIKARSAACDMRGFRNIRTKIGGTGREAPSAPAKERVKVELKNGSTFTAEVVEEREASVTFRIKGGTFALPASDILKME